MHSLSSCWWSVVVPTGRPAFSAKTVPVIKNGSKHASQFMGKERIQKQFPRRSALIEICAKQPSSAGPLSTQPALIFYFNNLTKKPIKAGLLNIERNLFREQDTSNKLRILHGSAEIRNFSSSELSERVKYFSTQEENFRIFKRPVMIYLLYKHQWNTKPSHFLLFHLRG